MGVADPMSDPAGSTHSVWVSQQITTDHPVVLVVLYVITASVCVHTTPMITNAVMPLADVCISSPLRHSMAACNECNAILKGDTRG